MQLFKVIYKIINRRLNVHKQRNILSIIISLILVICIYLTNGSVEKFENVTNVSSINPLKIFVCPQLSSSSGGYFRVDLAENTFINNSFICKSNDILLIYILSTITNFQRRQSIRQTWARKKDYQQLNNICFVFIVGIPSNSSELTSNINIKHESLMYGDIVQLNITETYENVVYKEVGALKWSYIYASHIPFLFKTDDDLIIDSLLLSDVVQFFLTNRTDHSFYLQKQEMQSFVEYMLNVDKYTLFKGKNIGGIDTRRTGKFRIHDLAWNHDKLPSYCSGFGLIYSSFVRDRLYRASLCYGKEYVPLVGDVFLSGFLAGAASVQCSGWPMMHFQRENKCEILFQQHSLMLVCSTTLHLGHKNYSEFYSSWKIIRNRHIIN